MRDITPDLPATISIRDITDENPHVKTFWFDYKLNSRPGQFVLLWIPRLEQKPFSIAYDTGDRFGLSIFAVGPLSTKLFAMKPGDRVGLTGPYGTSFSVKPNTHYITVAGGYGAGPLGVLAEKVTAKNSSVDFCIGARAKDLLLFEDRAAKLPNTKVHVSTDDGSSGHKGNITEVLEKLLIAQLANRPIVSACGPELMERAILDLCNKYDVDCELSIERYMKCGYSICGQCCMDELGIPMCTKGPVVSREITNQLSEFGKYHRDKAGAKIGY